MILGLIGNQITGMAINGIIINTTDTDCVNIHLYFVFLLNHSLFGIVSVFLFQIIKSTLLHIRCFLACVFLEIKIVSFLFHLLTYTY